MLKLRYSSTSPFVRKVRVVAIETGQDRPRLGDQVGRTGCQCLRHEQADAGRHQDGREDDTAMNRRS